MRQPHHPDFDSVTLERVLYALSDPVRLQLVSRLFHDGPLCCNALDLGIPKSTASHHFRVLREAGIMFTQPRGTHFINSLRKKELNQRFPTLLNTLIKAWDAQQRDC